MTKLYKHQEVYNNRLEALRKEKETEEAEKLRDKPRILRKSAKLAEKAEKKLFKEFGVSFADYVLKETQPHKESSPLAPSKTYHYQSCRPETRLEIPSRKQSPVLILKKVPIKKKTGFYYMSVLERSKYWADRKAKKIAILREKKEEETMKGCTFAPVCHSRAPQVYQQFSPSQLKNTLTSLHVSKMGSVNSDALGEYSPLSPYSQKIAFPAGCDVNNFYARSYAN